MKNIRIEISEMEEKLKKSKEKQYGEKHRERAYENAGMVGVSGKTQGDFAYHSKTASRHKDKTMRNRFRTSRYFIKYIRDKKKKDLCFYPLVRISPFWQDVT